MLKLTRNSSQKQAQCRGKSARLATLLQPRHNESHASIGRHEKRGAKIDRYQSSWSASPVAIMLRRLLRRVQTPASALTRLAAVGKTDL